MITEEDIENLYEAHVDSIYRFFYAKTIDINTSEDLTSDTFLHFVRAVKKQKSIKKPVYFLYGIARNVFFSYLKRKYKYKDFVSFGVDASGFESYVQSTLNQKVNFEDLLLKLLPKIPEKQREILHKRFIEKMSLKEITAFLGKDMNYVKTTQKRGLRSLRKLLSCTP